MALDFPSSVSTGTTFTGQNGVTYEYDGKKWTATGNPTLTLDRILTSTASAILDGSDILLVRAGLSLQSNAKNIGLTAYNTANNITNILSINTATGIQLRANSNAGFSQIILTPTGTSVHGNFIPATNLAFDLGSTSSQWRSLYVGTSTIYLGGNSLSVAGGNLTLNGSPIVGGGGNGLSISDFGLGFVNNLDNGKITTSKLYNENPNPGLNNQYELSVDNGGVVHLPDQSVINGATLKTVPGNYAGITAGPQGADEDSWVWVDNDGAWIATKYSTDQFTWKFNNSGTFTLPYGQSIGSGTLDGIKLTTDRGTVLFGNTPECVPTLASHFHIMRDDPTTVDLFFGDDFNYVKLPYDSTLTNVGVEISADGHSWQFDKGGTLTLPSGNTRIGNVFGTDGMLGNTGTSVGVASQGQGGYAALQWLDDPEDATYVAAIVVNSPIASTSGTVQIATGVVAGPTAENVWEFDADGNLTIPDDIKDANGSVIRVATTSTAPTRVNGQLWFNSEEGRTYIKYNGQWIDASPTIVPRPETYLDEITIDGSTINMNGSTLAINTAGVLLVNGSEVTGSGGATDRLTTGSHSIILGSDGMVTFPTIEGTKTLWGAVDEDFYIRTTRTDPGQDADIELHAADDLRLFAEGDDLEINAANAVRIYTDYTNTNYTWEFGNNGVLTLPNGGTIFDSGPGGGWLAIAPANAGIGQALVLYPTQLDGNHIHLTANGNNTDLYLGTDEQYVKVDHSGTVVVGTYSTATSTSTWTFGVNGVLTLSTASTILGNSTDPNVYIETSTTATTSTWTFGTDGVLTLPAATPVIKGGGTGTDVTVIATTGTNTSTWTFAADGGLTFPDASVQTTAWTGTSVLVNGTYTVALSTTGQLNLPGAANTESGNARIQSTNSIDILSNLSLWTFGTDGNLTFPNGGVIGTAFGDNAPNLIGTEDLYAELLSYDKKSGVWVSDQTYSNPVGGGVGIATNSDPVTGVPGNQWAFRTDGTTTLASGVEISNTGTFNFLSWNTGTALIIADVPYDAGSFIYIPSSSDTNGSLGISNTNTSGSIMLTQGNGNTTNQLYVNNSGTTINNILGGISKTWTFGTDGSVTFPDATVQTTAYTGTVAYSNITGAPASVNKTSGSWTLAPGANTVSITVAPGNNYQMWVNGNIPNGIVEWNATVNVSNTNVPAIGSQYGWYYAAGNALVLTSMPAQIVGTAGVISTATVATTSSNVFRFGITNNSTSTQVINWGYTTL
jgi:hypothetical protein